MDPIVSVIVPVYNRPQLLRRALLSLEKQTFSDFECLIIDDGSTDNTRDIAFEFVKKDPRFKLIKKIHGVGNMAINMGILKAKGRYIGLLGSDDEYSSEHIKLRVNELDLNPDIDMLRGGIKVIGNEMVPDKRDMKKLISLYDSIVYIGGTAFGKREVFLKLKGFKKMLYASDSEFIERAIASFNVKKVFWETYIYHRDHGNSITDSFLNNKADNSSS